MHRWGSGVLQTEPFSFAAAKNGIGRGRSLPQRLLQAEPFSFVATEIRIGRGRLLPRRSLQAGHSPLRQRRLESDAEGRCCDDCCRRNHSPSWQRRLESDAEDRCRNDCCRRNYSPLHRFACLSPKSRITARWRTFPSKNLQRFPNSPPEIKNHCSRGAVSGRNPAVILKLTPSNQESLQPRGGFPTKPCSDSQVWP